MIGGTQVVRRSKDSSSAAIQWDALYATLQLIARHYIYTFKVPSWRGQEKDLIDEVVQETVVRILERSQQAECGEASPIYALEYMMGTIIRNYCIDLSRRDRRLMRTLSACPSERQDVWEEGEDITEKATRNVYDEELFTLVACEVVKFPPKQRTALLTDLATSIRCRMRCVQRLVLSSERCRRRRQRTDL